MDGMDVQEHAEGESYALAAELVGHEADVRGVCEVGEGVIASVSRDRTVRVWSGPRWSTSRTLLGHQHYVSTVIRLPSGSTQLPKGGFASGGNDGLIHIWDMDHNEPVMTLVGHEKPVVTLATTPTGLLISGSWDFTARVWQGADCVHELKGHSQAVWAVLALPSGDILTGSADKTIKLWRDGKCLQTFSGHSDVVRALQVVEGVGFMSASNDGCLRIWALSGDCVAEYHAHSAFIFSAAVLSNGLMATASDDHTVKLWREGKCIQTLQHPATVWSVAPLENGDIVTGCADGVARVWSARPEAALPADQLAAYDAKVTNIAVPKGAIGDMNIEKLPGPEALIQPGHSEGERLIIRNGSKVEVYMWDSAKAEWNRFGEVVDAVGTPAKSVVDGREYDYVFDVDLGDGLPPRKLGYNATENPWTAAQHFIWREELSQSYLDQVANFIIANSSPISLSQAQGPSYQDPFTGANRYVPSSHTPSTNENGLDPFTGTSSYRTDEARVPTYARRSVSEQEVRNLQTSSPASYTHFPVRAMLYFDQSNFDGIYKKLCEFSAQLAIAGDEVAALSWSEKEAAQVASLIRTLKDTSRYHASSFSNEELRVVRKMLKWPAQQRFPVLDLIRSIAVHQEGAAFLARSEVWKELEAIVIESLKDALQATNQMLALRALVNSFRFKNTRDVIASQAEIVLEASAYTASSHNKNVRLSLATLLLKEISDLKVQATSMIAELLKIEDDEEVLYRALVALGTLAADDPATIGIAKDLSILAGLHPDERSPKVQATISDLRRLLA